MSECNPNKIINQTQLKQKLIALTMEASGRKINKEEQELMIYKLKVLNN